MTTCSGAQSPARFGSPVGRRAGRGGGRGRGTGPRQYGGTELTERGQKEADAFTQQDNPRFKCETTSILFDWPFDGPVNRITQNRDTIVLQYGQLGLRRTIYTNMKEHPKTMLLERTYEATDPIYLKGKYTGRDVIQPADAPYAPDKCKEQQFINYSKQQK